MKPHKSILDRAFAYTPASATTPEYLRAKFRKIARELAAAAKAKPAPVAVLKRAASK